MLADFFCGIAFAECLVDTKSWQLLMHSFLPETSMTHYDPAKVDLKRPERVDACQF